MQGRNRGGLRNVKTHFIAPVDLNALMFMNFSNLSEFHSLLGDEAKKEEFACRAARVKETIREVMFDQEDGVWYDYDIHNQVREKKRETLHIPKVPRRSPPRVSSEV